MARVNAGHDCTEARSLLDCQPEVSATFVCLFFYS